MTKNGSLKNKKLVILLDVDNTLLDNDRFVEDLTQKLDDAFGIVERQLYWSIYNELRASLGYADYLGTLQKFREEVDDQAPLLSMSSFFLNYPFSERFYPQALSILHRLGKIGTTVILSDGDMVFQPRKIQNSGIWKAVNGRVIIDIHKEKNLDAMQRRFPAEHYIMIDDKPKILTTMKEAMDKKLTTVFVRQGHYATQANSEIKVSLLDLTIDHIADSYRVLVDFFSRVE